MNLWKLYRLRQLGTLIAALRVMGILIRAEKLRQEEAESDHSTDTSSGTIVTEGDQLAGSNANEKG